MKLLVDSDIFCKLGKSELLHKAIELLGADISECARLAALPHMLERGGLVNTYGSQTCKDLATIAQSMPVVSQPDDVWLDKLAQVQSIDIGEAQLFAAGAESGLIVMTGDKRALLALKDIPEFRGALAGRIVVLEAILISLCDNFGPDEVRRCVQGLAETDTMVRICFSSGVSDPVEGLLSYFADLKAEIDPIVLWDPRPEGQA